MLLSRHVTALAKFVKRVRVFVIPMRIVGGVHNDIIADEIHRGSDQAFFRLGGEKNISTLVYVLTWALAKQRCIALAAVFILLVEAIQKPWNPSDAGLQKGEAHCRKFLKHALKHHARELAKNSVGMRYRVCLNELRENLGARRHPGARGVHAYRHIELRCPPVYGIKARMAQEMRAVRRKHDTYQPDLLASSDFGHVRLMRGQQAHAKDPVAPLTADFGEPAVICPAECPLIVRLFYISCKQPNRRIEYRSL